MQASDPPVKNSTTLRIHDFRQPLNVIRLATGNIRVRVLPLLTPTDAAYLIAKLDSIDAEVGRAVALAEVLVEPAPPPT